MAQAEIDLSPEIQELGIEQYARELDSNGLTIVPPEVNQFGLERIDRIVEIILERAEAMTGSKFTLDDGPLDELEFPRPELTPEQMKQIEARGLTDALLKPTQFLIQKLTQVDRIFRDLAVNPVSVALQNHMMAGQTRLSSANCFVKWQGDFGYGPGLGLHDDQGRPPLPWGPVAHTGNSTWCLTDYTLDGGALAYVQGTHTEGKPAPPPERVYIFGLPRKRVGACVTRTSGKRSRTWLPRASVRQGARPGRPNPGSARSCGFSRRVCASDDPGGRVPAPGAENRNFTPKSALLG